MTVIPEVHAALRANVAAGTIGRRRRPRPRIALTLSLAAAFAISGTAIAATGAWRPVLGFSSGEHPRPATRPLAPQLRGDLAVLSRPQTDADRGPAVQAALRYGLYSARNLPHVGDVRLLATHRGGAAVLVPLDRVDYQHPTRPRRDRLCVLYTRTVHGVGTGPAAAGHVVAVQSCGDLAHLRAGTITSWLPGDQVGPNGARMISGLTETHQWGLVPDGVARVKVTFYGRTTAWATVANNFYDAMATTTRVPKSTQWFAADGRALPIPAAPKHAG